MQTLKKEVLSYQCEGRRAKIALTQSNKGVTRPARCPALAREADNGDQAIRCSTCGCKIPVSCKLMQGCWVL